MSLQKERIGTTLTVVWEVLTNGDAVSLDGRDIRVFAIDPHKKRTEMTDLQIGGSAMDVVTCVFEGKVQEHPGIYQIECIENYNKPNQAVLDDDVIMLVPRSKQRTGGSIGLATPTIQLTTGTLWVGVKGKDGKSAYELAVADGYEGTVTEWLASLHGRDADIAAATAATNAANAAAAAANDAAEDAEDATTAANTAASAANTAASSANAGEVVRQQNETQRNTNETNRQNSEAQRQQTFQTNEAARQTAYQNAEANRNGAYQEAEEDRDETFNSKEATRDAANQAALNCADTLAALGPKIEEVTTSAEELENGESWTDVDKRISGHYACNKQGEQVSNDVTYCTGLVTIGDGISFTAYTPSSSSQVAYILYDANKEVISWYRGTSGQRVSCSVSPNDGYYVRWCGNDVNSSKKYTRTIIVDKIAQKIDKTAIANDLEGGTDRVLSAEQGKLMGNDVENLKNEIFEYEPSAQQTLEEGSTWSDEGYYYYTTLSVINKDGSRSSSNSTYSTCIVPVGTGIRFRARTPNNDTYVAYCLYDANKNVVGWYRDEVTDVNKTYEVLPKDAAYVRWSAASTSVLKGYYILTKVSRVKGTKPQYDGIIGKDGIRVSIASFGDADTHTFTTYPSYNLWGDKLNIIGKVTTFSKIIIYRGDGSYGCKRIEIDNTNIKTYNSSNVTQETFAHGLTISGYIAINIDWLDNGQMRIKMNTLNASMMDGTNNYHIFTTWGYATGQLKVESDGTTLTNMQMSVTNNFFRTQFWIFGASQEGLSAKRWLGQLKLMGYTNLLANALPGRASNAILTDLKKALNFGCPKYLYFGLSNDGYTYDTYKVRMDAAKECADEYGITIIFVCKSVTPNETSGSHAEQLTKRNTVINYGCRYWDFGKACNQDPEDPTTIYEGYLDSNYVHPATPVAALSLAIQFCADVPEVMQYAEGGSTQAALPDAPDDEPYT